MRHLGVSHTTAWRVKHKHKLLQVMKERDDSRLPCGVILVDDAYWGGELHDDTPGRGSRNKVHFIVARACNDEGRPVSLRMG
jgi:predicted O-methyltransferase YrrM